MRAKAQKKRRTQKERRRHTQEAVLSAAIQVLLEDGYLKFSASRVAAKAGVSRGAQEHYFSTKNALVAAAARYAMDKAIAHATSLASSANRSSDPITKFLADSEHFFFDPTYRAMTEIAFSARVQPSIAGKYRRIVKDARDVLNAIWLEALAKAGHPRKNAQQFIDLTHYLLRGMFFASVWLPYHTDRRALLDTWAELAPYALKRGGPIDRAKRRASSNGRERHLR